MHILGQLEIIVKEKIVVLSLKTSINFDELCEEFCLIKPTFVLFLNDKSKQTFTQFYSVKWVSDTRRMSIFWVLRNTSTSFVLDQPVCITRRYVVYVNYFTNLSTVVMRLLSVLICSACLEKIVSNLVKDSCIILISVCSCVMLPVIVGVSILFLVAWAYNIFGRPSVFCGAAGLSLSCPVYL
jgi:hypothetical protein